MKLPTPLSLLFLACTLTGSALVGESVESAMLADEAKRLLAPSSVQTEAVASGDKPWVLQIEDIDLPEQTQVPDFSRWPQEVTSLRIDGEQFTRNGEPVFLLGFETHIAYPWLMRLLAADFAHTQDTSAMATLRVRKDPENRKGTAFFREEPLLDAQLPRYLDHGLALWIQPFEEKQDVFRNTNLPFYAEMPHLYVNSSHFISYRFEEPQGRQLRENMWKSFIRTTREYPVFAYELFNEARYMDYSPANIAGFRDVVAQKYGSIEAANNVWGTHFEQFAAVEPPRKMNAAGGTLMGLKPKDFSRPLWVDWQKYIEDVFAAHVDEVSRYVKSIDHNPAAYTTVQSVFDLSHDYSGGGGLHPVKVLAQSDFLSMETGGGAYVAQQDGESYEEIKIMMLPLMLSDLAVAMSPGKPLIDVEIPLVGYGRAASPKDAPYDLSGDWKFSPASREEGLAQGMETAQYDDSDWKEIRVPGHWGTQGYPDATHGWYRKTFDVPANAAAGGSGKDGSSSNSSKARLYLNGSKLADRSVVYLNGNRVVQTTAWNERFGVDVTDFIRYGEPNTVSVGIENTYFDNNMYWGGIRDYLVLDTRPYGSSVPLSPQQMRSFFWERIAHGKSGVVPSYLYTAEGDRLSMFNPNKVSWEAIAVIPSVLREIGNVSDIVLADHRRPGQVALAYSLESGRERVAKDYEAWLRAPASKDTLDYYSALLFGPVRPAVIDGEVLRSGELDAYRAVLLRMNERVPGGVIDNLETYVNNGGIVVIDHGSLAVDDDTHSPLRLEALTGVEVGGPLTEQRELSAADWWGKGVKTKPRLYDQHTGRAVRARTADVIATFTDGSPAITRKQQGKGYVYYVAAELPQEALQGMLGALFAAHGIVDTDIAVEAVAGQPLGRYVEARLFEKDGEALAYLHNWGSGPAPLRLRLPSIADGSYRVRQLQIDAEEVPEQIISGAELREGISVLAPSQDPVALLIEEAAAPARPLPVLSAEHRELLELFGPGPRGGKRVLISAGHAETMTKVRMLTATRMLGQDGYEVNTSLGELLPQLRVFTDRLGNDQLENYDAVITLGSGPGLKSFSEEELRALRNYVVAGGGLVIAANEHIGPHWWFSNSQSKQPLTALFGVGTTETNIADAQTGRDGTPGYPLLFADAGSAAHPIMTGVDSVQSLGMSVLRPDNPAGSVLLRSGEAATPANAPAAVALEFGKGRVVVLGDAKWLQPDSFAQADNAQFFQNIIHWVTGEEDRIAPLSDAERERIVRHGFELNR